VGHALLLFKSIVPYPHDEIVFENTYSHISAHKVSNPSEHLLLFEPGDSSYHTTNPPLSHPVFLTSKTDWSTIKSLPKRLSKAIYHHSLMPLN